jgi:hypothetical protein
MKLIVVDIRHYRTELVGNAAQETSLWNEVQKRHFSTVIGNSANSSLADNGITCS